MTEQSQTENGMVNAIRALVDAVDHLKTLIDLQKQLIDDQRQVLEIHQRKIVALEAARRIDDLDRQDGEWYREANGLG